MQRRAKYTYLFEDEDVRRWYENTSRGSLVSADVCLRRLGSFCEQLKIKPKEFAALPDRELHNMLMDYVSSEEKEGHAGNYINSTIKALKSWLAHNQRATKIKIKINGIDETPTLKDERVPTFDELRRIFLSGDGKARTACALVAHGGLRLQTLGDYMCKECKHKFSDKGDSKGLKGNPLAVIAVADLYFKGLSLRAIEHHMNNIYSLDVSYPTIHRWIRRIIKNMKALEKEHSLHVGKTWHVDETLIKISGKLAYLWNALDAETKILLASEVTYGRSSEDAEMVIREALRKAETGPDEIVTDGLKSYNVALTKDYGCRITHVSKPKFTDPKNNNLVERVNGTLKTRIKGFRRLDNLSSSAQLFDGLRLYYNNKRPHSALGGKTPVDASLESGKKRI